jgi:hypothetical protein
VGTNHEGRNYRDSSRHAEHNSTQDQDEQDLLETILSDSMSGSNGESLKLIFQVARASEYKDTSRIGAVEEFVRAILQQRFGGRKFSSGFVNRVASALIEVPEAAVKLEHLWQEARASG